MSIITLSKNDEWETPGDLYTKICEWYNVRPLLDVCATRNNRKCLDFYDKQSNALEYPWTKTFWMNPPYSELSLWLAKAYHEHQKYNITGVALIFSKTDTKAWHSFIEGKAEVYFMKGRVKFLLDGIIPKWCKECKELFIKEITRCPVCNERVVQNAAPYPSAVVIWRRRD